MQFLSEPSGGSDVAGALTTAVRDGDEWILERLEGVDDRRVVVRLGPVPGPHQLGRPEAPRPDGVHASHRTRTGIEVHRIEMLNGFKEFCQEFLTDVRVPDTDRVGDVDDGLDGRHPVDVPRAHAAQLALRHHARPATCAPRRAHDLDVARDAGAAATTRARGPHR